LLLISGELPAGFLSILLIFKFYQIMFTP